MGDINDRHIEVSKNLLKLSRQMLAEATEKNDKKLNDLGIIFLIINGVFLDNRSFTKLSNSVKMFSNSELFETLMQTDLRDDIINKINEFSEDVDIIKDDFGSITKEIFDKLDYVECVCDDSDRQEYDGNKYPEHKGFCLNCGGKI